MLEQFLHSNGREKRRERGQGGRMGGKEKKLIRHLLMELRHTAKSTTRITSALVTDNCYKRSPILAFMKTLHQPCVTIKQEKAKSLSESPSIRV